MSGRSGALAIVLVVACNRTKASPATTAAAPPPLASLPADTDGPPAPAAPVAAEPIVARLDRESWPAFVRGEHWDAAWQALDALSDVDKAAPEIRYVRARVALAREQPVVALPLLDGLEGSLPLLADDIGRFRATAELSVGPFIDAGEWFAARAAPDSQLDAARAFEKARDAKRARAAVERVVGHRKRTHSEEAQARALRIRVAETVGDIERADARWLATHGADAGPADGLALVARLDPKRPLTAHELLIRARVLTDAGRTDDALHAIDLAAGAPNADGVTDLERARARGTALFRAHGRWNDAAKALAECAGAGGPHAAEDAFHAARALSRADRDEEAMRAYEDVERRFPKSPWAEDAAFFGPYLRMLHGDWRGCAAGFDAYARVHAGGEHDRDARRDGALCKLLEGDAKGARPAFERLSEDIGSDSIGSARMANMAALAALRDGDRTHAVALWTDVARTHPLSWPSLVARARLAEAGAPIPPAIEAPAPTADAAAPLAIALPPPADLLHRLGLEADAESALHDREGAVTSGAGGRVAEALCQSYGLLARARRRYQVAQLLPSALFASAPIPPTQWAWDCAFPTPYASDVHAAESSEGLPPGLVWAVMRQESAFDPEAVSPARAVGLMQLLPETARPIADELSLPDARWKNPQIAIDIGARVLRKVIDRFHGDLPLAIAAYNAGAEPVERWLSRAPGLQIDTFVEHIPYDETRDYVARVMGNLARYAYLGRGEEGVPKLEIELKANALQSAPSNSAPVKSLPATPSRL